MTADRDDDYYQPWLDRPATALPVRAPKGARPMEGEPPLGVDLDRYARDTQWVGDEGDGVAPWQDAAAAPRTPKAKRAPADHLLPTDDRAARLARPAAPRVTLSDVTAATRRGLGRFADWTIALGATADVPTKVEALEIPRRAGVAWDWTRRFSVRTAQRTAALTEQTARTVASASARAARQGGQGLRHAADVTRERVAGMELDAKLGDAATRAKAGIGAIADSATAGVGTLGEEAVERIRAVVPRREEPPAPPESGLARLLEEEGEAPIEVPAAPTSRRTATAVPDLPLFGGVALAGGVAGSTVDVEPDDDAPLDRGGASAGDAPVEPAATTPAAVPPRAPRDTARRDGGGAGAGGTGAMIDAGAARMWIAGLAGALIVGLPLAWWGGSRTATSDAQIASVVESTLLNKPEIIPAALDRLQANRSATALAPLRADLEKPFSGAWAGNPQGDVTLVVFSDFACGFCRKSVADIDRLIAEDPKLKVVFRELPILSPASSNAAAVALAAAQQGKYMAFHQAMFAAGTPTATTIASAANKAGIKLDGTASTPDEATVRKEIERNMDAARKLGFEGTPSWIVGDRVLHGAVGYDALTDAIAAARAG